MMMRLFVALALLLPLAFAQIQYDPDPTAVEAVSDKLTVITPILRPGKPGVHYVNDELVDNGVEVYYSRGPEQTTTFAPVNIESTLWEDLQEHAEEYYNFSKDVLIQAEENYGLMPLIGAAVGVSSLLTCLTVSCCCFCCCRRKKAKTGRYQFSNDEMA